MSKIKLDITNQRFGRLVALSPTDQRKDKKVVWKFICDCGKIHFTTARSVMAGHTKSCGCIAVERIRMLNYKHGAAIKHGKRPRSYQTWIGMLSRCTHSWNDDWERYGGRGIKVCERWKDYKNFLSDMGEPKKDLTIERIDNDGNYEPENCRWATRLEQSHNTSRNRLIKYKGKVFVISELARKLKITLSKLHYNLSKGLSIEEIINGR